MMVEPMKMGKRDSPVLWTASLHWSTATNHTFLVGKIVV